MPTIRPSTIDYRLQAFLALPLCFFLLLPGCGPSHEENIARIDSLRTQAETLIRAQSAMGWDSWVFGKTSNQDSLYRIHGGLFTRENIDLVRRAEANEADLVQKKRLRYLERYLATEFISKQIASLTDSVSNLEATLTVTIDGKEVAYRQVNGMMAAERVQERRARMYTALDGALDRLNPLLLEVEQAYQRVATDLGYRSYDEMVGDLKEIDLEAFRDVCEQLLDETEEQYLMLLEEQLRSLPGVSPDTFHRYDTGPLFRSQMFIPYFPADSILPVARRTFAGMGIDLASMRNLQIDAEPRERKNPRAVCFPVDVPTDVRLSIKPNGGPDDYMALFHELGHGLHFAHTAEHSVEFKYMGEPTVTETHAFLCEYLVADQAWLRQMIPLPTDRLKEFVRSQAFRRLYYIRRYSAKFLYEHYLHSGQPDPDAFYAETLSRATGYRAIPSDRKRYLTDLDPLYYSAGYLRAWFLETQVSAAIAERFGVNWFENTEAGEYLQVLWAQGDRTDGDELASALGYDGISPERFIEKVNAMVLFSTP